MEKKLLQEEDKERLFNIPLFRDLPHNIKLSLLDKLDYAVYDVKNILVLRNAFEKTRKQMKANTLSINTLSDNLSFLMFAKLTLKKT